MTNFMFAILMLAMLTQVFDVAELIYGLLIVAELVYGLLSVVFCILRFVSNDPFRTFIAAATVYKICLKCSSAFSGEEDDLVPNVTYNNNEIRMIQSTSGNSKIRYRSASLVLLFGHVSVPAKQLAFSISKSVNDMSGFLMSGFFVSPNSAPMSFELIVAKNKLTALLFRHGTDQSSNYPIAVFKDLATLFDCHDGQPRLRLDGRGVQITVKIKPAENHPWRTAEFFQPHKQLLEDSCYITVGAMSLSSPLPHTPLVSSLNLQCAPGRGCRQVMVSEKEEEEVPMELVEGFVPGRGCRQVTSSEEEQPMELVEEFVKGFMKIFRPFSV